MIGEKFISIKKVIGAELCELQQKTAEHVAEYAEECRRDRMLRRALIVYPEDADSFADAVISCIAAEYEKLGVVTDVLAEDAADMGGIPQERVVRCENAEDDKNTIAECYWKVYFFGKAVEAEDGEAAEMFVGCGKEAEE
ncbi:MAG: hypothetical protein IJF27_08515 [Oscillospiraceae bacterium]|nr:hypothetical protein [Oscillospiraceae bacterium]MBQ3050021.1 hypothetical protein [Oscillospiraceae bacterium]